jgi:hypothetical protein
MSVDDAIHKSRRSPGRSSATIALRTWGLRLLVLLGCCSCFRATVDAEEPTGAPDIPVRAAPPASLPELPPGFIEEHIGQVKWAFHERSRDVARTLQEELPETYREIARELGNPELSSEMVVRLARTPEEFARLAPSEAPPPAYAVGVAYPSLGLIVLNAVNPSSWFPLDLSAVLTHELSHIALYRAVSGQRVPRWFVEGLAVHQAGEQSLGRVQTLWEAAVIGEVLPLSKLSAHFPSRPHEVNRAYAQSADLVAHMLRTENDRARLPRLLEHVAAGMPFEQAVLAAYKVDLDYLDREWRQALTERFRVLPLVLTGTALWGGIAVLAVVAFVRRRREHHAKLARWAQEEAEHERAMQALELQRQNAALEEAAQTAAVLVPLPRESGVPTIEHEGQRYTLH